MSLARGPMKEIVCTETSRLGRQLFRDRLRAVILTGSLARDEGTFVEDNGGWRLHGDAEFLFIFGDGATIPPEGDITVMRGQLEQRLHRKGVHAEITVSAIRPNYLRRLEPSIFAYELKTCGEAVAGDREVLSLIPEFGPADIPREDAWRMLSNRLVEQLESTDELLERRPTLSPDARYRTVKLYLDMATSLLVFVGGYGPTYEERAKTLSLITQLPAGTPPLPFALASFANDVAECTAWKLGPNGHAQNSRRFWERAVDYAQALWTWELTMLQGGAASASMNRWIRHQPMAQRLRGWAHVVRQEGWLASCPNWPRWCRHALAVSPRYAVYAAGTNLLFQLRSASGSDGPCPSAANQNTRLPIVTIDGSRSGKAAWRHAAADVLRNYHKFVVNTCA